MAALGELLPEVVVRKLPVRHVVPRVALTRVALTGGLVLAGVTAMAAPASAGTCSFDGGTRTATASIGSGDVELRLVASGSDLQVNGVTCASLSAIETVDVSMAQRPDGTATFDLGGGPLGPGFSNEGDGSSEIEFSVSTLANFGSVKVVGSSGGDNITLGQESTGQLNLNAAVDGATPDVDVTWDNLFSNVVLDGQAGDDTLSAAGALPTSLPYANSVGLIAGPGSNNLVGGSGGDGLFVTTEVTSTGHDTVVGGSGFDRLAISTESNSLQSTYSLDGLANDGVNCPGTLCEGDNVGVDVEMIQGSPGAETLIGSNDGNALVGGGGIDVLKGLGGPDNLQCSGGKAIAGPGDDFVSANAGCASASGGTGNDQVSFNTASEGVTVTLDGVKNDGPSTDVMNVLADIEDVVGSEFADTLTGSDKRNVLQGGSGSDGINGGGGNDRIAGERGNDSLNGGPGDDKLAGGPGSDLLDGGDGMDACGQGPGSGTSVNCE